MPRPTANQAPHHLNTLKWHLKTEASRRTFSHEACMLAVTGALVRAIEELGLTRAEVAERIGRSPGFVSQVLNGSRNMTLRTLADILWACGLQLRDLDVSPIGESRMSRGRMDEWLDSENTHRHQVTAHIADVVLVKAETPPRMVQPAFSQVSTSLLASGSLIFG